MVQCCKCKSLSALKWRGIIKCLRVQKQLEAVVDAIKGKLLNVPMVTMLFIFIVMVYLLFWHEMQNREQCKCCYSQQEYKAAKQIFEFIIFALTSSSNPWMAPLRMG